MLRIYSLVTTVLAGGFLLGVVHEVKTNQTLDTLTVHQIKIVDREGKLAMIITDHDDFPPPIVNGKVYKRSGGSDSNGIVFYNQQGDEQGALDWSGRKHANGTFDSANTLSYDSVNTDQLLQVDDGYDDNGKLYAFMIGWNRSRYDTPEFARVIDELQKAKTPAERSAIIAQHPNLRSATRFLIGYDNTNTSQVMLADGKGKPRVKLFVTADGTAALQFLDENGKVTSQFPQAK